MGVEELSKITYEIYNYPGRNINIIKVMREAYPNKFKEKNTNINSKDTSTPGIIQEYS
jgi:hypothetical protein